MTNRPEPMVLYLLTEHQSSPDKIMPLRLWHYTCLILRKYIKQTKKRERMPVVFPIVFYNGKQRPYPYSMNIFDLFANKELARSVYNKPFQLVDITMIEDAATSNADFARYMVLLQKHIRSNTLKDKLPLIFESCPDDRDIVRAVLKYMIRAASMKFDRVEEFVKLVSEYLPEAEDDVMTLIEQFSQQRYMRGIAEGEARGKAFGRNEGRTEGRTEGIAEGETSAMKAIAKRMLAQGHSAHDIANLVGLNKAEVERIQTT